MPELPAKPLNREPDIADLVSSFITQKEGLAYDRNHCPHPQLDGSTHRVRIDGAVNKELRLSKADLETDYPQHSVVCALQCAGNRRHTMRTLIREVQGVDWFDGAVMNCKWTGPRLKDILEKAGITLTKEQRKTAHVAFACYAIECQDDTWYGASIDLARALRDDADVLVATKMNDEDLPIGHGFPMRIVTPGIAGARAVKWVEQITVQVEESRNHYQKRDYKVLPPDAVDAESAEPYWGTTPPIQEMPVNSVIAVPEGGSTIKRDDEGCVTVKGYALPSGDDGPVVKVEVSTNGEQWVEAELLSYSEEGKWSWKLWQAKVQMSAGKRQILLSKATDAAGNTQPRKSQWNLRGVCYNGYGEARELTTT